MVKITKPKTNLVIYADRDGQADDTPQGSRVADAAVYMLLIRT